MMHKSPIQSALHEFSHQILPLNFTQVSFHYALHFMEEETDLWITNSLPVIPPEHAKEELCVCLRE